MKIDLSNKQIKKSDRDECRRLLKIMNRIQKPDIEKMWYILDFVWDEMNCNNRDLNSNTIAKFYAHPVWLLNGLFIEQDKESMSNRVAYCKWIVSSGSKRILDYGGGFGTLAVLISKKSKECSIDIFEPFPSEFALRRCKSFENISFINQLPKQDYDCLASTSVLEHLQDPLVDFYEMIKSVKPNGFLVMQNAFDRKIKCHLPQNLHFRYTFNLFAWMMGLGISGRIKGSCTTIFVKRRDIKPNWERIRFFEQLSKRIFPLLDLVRIIVKPFLKPILKSLKLID